jgi:hypothetical protein
MLSTSVGRISVNPSREYLRNMFASFSATPKQDVGTSVLTGTLENTIDAELTADNKWRDLEVCGTNAEVPDEDSASTIIEEGICDVGNIGDTKFALVV